LQAITVYAQSVYRVHEHNGLDATPLTDNDISNRLKKRHSLIG